MRNPPCPSRSPFLPPELDAGDLAQVEPLFRELAARPVSDAESLAQWLRDESDLLAACSAAVARRYIAMTCDTEDAAVRERFLAIERDVVPATKQLGDALDRKLLQLADRFPLDPTQHGTLLRRRRAAAAIFRSENVELQRQESELHSRQQAVMGALLVSFDGREHTLPAMAAYQEEPDRTTRERAWRATIAARASVWPELLDIFDRLVRLRAQMATNAGFPDYTAYRFQQLQRLDYGPETCRRLHDAIAAVVVPAVARLDRHRQARLGLTALRPWDLTVALDVQTRHRPFGTEDELLTLAGTLFARVDPQFAGDIDDLRRRGLLDLMSRKGKAPGGYQYTLDDVGLPFIFANAVGTHDDVQTLLHEGGHAFHALLSRHEPLLANRDAPIEMAETASMSMELMALEHLDAVYSPADARAARARHLEGLLRLLPWIASIDAFQHRVYAQPDAGRDARNAEWLAIRARFAPGVDYTGLEQALAHQWLQQGHLFTHPHYYIEYAIAQLAALQVWQAYRREPQATVAAYRRGLALGGRSPLPQLFAATGVEFDPSLERIASLVADVETELARLRQPERGPNNEP